MLNYLSAKEIAKKWEITQGQVIALCTKNQICGAMNVGNMWIIPSDTQKPDGWTNQFEQAEVQLRPFVKWAGGKSQLVKEITKLIPNEEIFTKYAEPMVGGGAMFLEVLSKKTFQEYYICDTNMELINAYQAIKNSVEELISKLAEMQMMFLPMDDNGRKYYYYNIRKHFNSTKLNNSTSVAKAAEFIFLNKTCFNGLFRVNKNGDFNVPMGAYKEPKICDEENLMALSEAFESVQIECGDYTKAEEFIDNKTVTYFDPPYRPLSNTSNFTSYNADAFDDVEQIRLAEFYAQMAQKGAKVILSNSDPKNSNKEDEFFDELYKEFAIQRVVASRSINSKGTGRGKITELLIHN